MVQFFFAKSESVNYLTWLIQLIIVVIESNQYLNNIIYIKK